MTKGPGGDAFHIKMEPQGTNLSSKDESELKMCPNYSPHPSMWPNYSHTHPKRELQGKVHWGEGESKQTSGIKKAGKETSQIGCQADLQLKITQLVRQKKKRKKSLKKWSQFRIVPKDIPEVKTNSLWKNESEYHYKQMFSRTKGKWRNGL